MKNGQTIGQWLKWDFKANESIVIKDKNGNPIYFENSDGYWNKRKFDSLGYMIYFEDSNGFFQYDLIPKIIEHNGRKYQLIP
jgi:hypothetical protein